jgi:endonuclease/exonuclease/phosphatase family metal-dependent hydrolase
VLAEVVSESVPRFLFWNIQGKALPQLIADSAQEHAVDIIVLAESTGSAEMLLTALNRDRSTFELCPGILCDSITIFANFQSSFMVTKSESARVSIRHLSLPARQDILLAAAHLPSKLHFSDDSLIFECTNLARMIADEERTVGHKRTILLGDLNVNPFETGMVGTGGLHSVMSRSVALKRTRTVQAREYDFFYNPMWSHFGDRGDSESGTYYYESAEHVVYFWNMFDQVLIRPELLDGFDSSTVRIVNSVSGTSLLRGDGRPDPTVGSDHLPILADLDF